MKAKLLKRLRKRGRKQIEIISVTKENGFNVGMSIAYSDSKYKGLFTFGETEEQVIKRAEHIYIADYLQALKKGVK